MCEALVSISKTGRKRGREESRKTGFLKLLWENVYFTYMKKENILRNWC
jgi:hypothetical protein